MKPPTTAFSNWSKAVADDLVQRLRNSPPREICEHKLQKVKCPHCENDALEDALARKDAEIAELRADVRQANRICAREIQRAERAEARVREALSLLGEARNYLEGLDIADTIDALVLLDTEESK